MIDWPIAGQFILGGMVSGVFGMMLAKQLSTQRNLLNRVFSGLIFVVAAYVVYRSGQAVSDRLN